MDAVPPLEVRSGSLVCIFDEARDVRDRSRLVGICVATLTRMDMCSAKGTVVGSHLVDRSNAR
jgi:hypothetical protein